MWTETIIFFFGLLLLVGGSTLLVRSAVGIGKNFNLSPLVIGLTIVAIGTSAPEIIFSLIAVLRNEPSFTIGNIVGSNIFNILFVLGVGAMIVPLKVKIQLIRWDVPILIGISLFFWAIAYRGSITRSEGILLLVGILLYSLFAFYMERKLTRISHRLCEKSGLRARKEKPETGTYPLPVSRSPWLNGVSLLSSFALLWLGSEWIIRGGTQIAASLGVNKLFIGLTLIAAGTSLPELATSLAALLKKETDLAVGNIVGSNIFNLLGVTGIAALAAPRGIAVDPSAVSFDIPVMVAVAIAALPIFFTGAQIERWEGGLFILYYLFYVGYLAVNAAYAPGGMPFSSAFLYFLLPLTLITLSIPLVRIRRKKRK